MVGLMRLLLQYGDEIAELKARIGALEGILIRNLPNKETRS